MNERRETTGVLNDSKISSVLEELLGRAMETREMAQSVLDALTGPEPAECVPGGSNDIRQRCVASDLAALRHICGETQILLKRIIDRL